MPTIEPLLQYLSLNETGVPIYVQIRDQVLAAVATGRMQVGYRMPTMRQVAVHLKVDLNTVRRAYDALEQCGVLQLQQGRGSFITDAALRGQFANLDQRLDRLVAQTLAACAAEGVSVHAFADRLRAVIPKET